MLMLNERRVIVELEVANKLTLDGLFFDPAREPSDVIVKVMIDFEGMIFVKYLALGSLICKLC